MTILEGIKKMDFFFNSNNYLVTSIQKDLECKKVKDIRFFSFFWGGSIKKIKSWNIIKHVSEVTRL